MSVQQSPPWNLLRPLYLIGLSAAFLPLTIFNIITTCQFAKLTSWEAFQHAWFGRFWSHFGPLSRDSAAPKVEPLLRNARGIVLDIGPGSGQWLYLFGRARNDNIKKIYGVEPNAEHHKALRTAIEAADLGDIYEVLPVGVEDIEHCGIDKGTVDCIVTVQVLCSVPEPERIIKELYPYLRAGGVWIVYEHVKTKFTHSLVGYWQRKSLAEEFPFNKQLILAKHLSISSGRTFSMDAV